MERKPQGPRGLFLHVDLLALIFLIALLGTGWLKAKTSGSSLDALNWQQTNDSEEQIRQA